MMKGESLQKEIRGEIKGVNITYEKAQSAWKEFVPFICDLIEKRNVEKVCDIGGGANPVLTEDYIKERGIEYSVLDISQIELNKAPGRYNKILADIAAPDYVPASTYDLIISKMLAEHIPNAEQFHRNVLSSLSDKGMAVHFFPTLYALPFIVNRLIPERAASILLNFLAPRDRYQNDKFPAYYDWCRGPTRAQLRNFFSLGFEVIEYRGFFGHGYYDKIKIMKIVNEYMASYLLRHPNPYLTSYAWVVLKKRAAGNR